jgi:hypothetical protein
VRDSAAKTVPGTGEVARYPAETVGTHKDGNTEHNVTSTGSPTATPGNENLTLLLLLLPWTCRTHNKRAVVQPFDTCI